MSKKAGTRNKKRTIVDPKERVIQKLTLRGKKQGYLTVTEVLSVFPEAEEHLDQLDKLYEKLSTAGIHVFDVTAEQREEGLDAFAEGIKLGIEKKDISSFAATGKGIRNAYSNLSSQSTAYRTSGVTLPEPDVDSKPS